MANDTDHNDVQDEEYDENADEDFNPHAPAADDDVSSSSEDEGVAKKPKKRKAEAVEELDSGDEATIQERKRKRKRKSQDDAEESAGDGGFIRTRAQRLADKAERKQYRKTATGDVTIDVDQVWADLSSEPVGRPPPLAVLKPTDATDGDGDHGKENAPVHPVGGGMITIKRQIEFAGEITEVEETVPRSSKEAQQYLKYHPDAASNRSKDVKKHGLQRPLKRPSMFEPNPIGAIKGVPPERLRLRAPSRLDVLMAEKRAEEERKKKAEKMTAVQKSALDWKGFVEKEGLSDELDKYGKSKRGYLAREAFLDRAAGAMDEAARAARLKV